MRERRYVKFKLDLYDDTKTKIIDQKPERDFIHYFFARSIILAGKSDCEGDLYMAKNSPYTIETLAIEFNREAALIKVALDLLIELKMIEVTEDEVYRVKSFAKHQNIKVKESVEIKDKKEANVLVESNKEVDAKGYKIIEDMIKDKIQKECNDVKNKVIEEIQNEEITSDNISNSYIVSARHELNESKNYRSNSNNQHNNEANSEQSNLINLEVKENKKSPKKKNESKLVTELAVDEVEENPPLFFFTDGDMPPLVEGEWLVSGMTPV